MVTQLSNNLFIYIEWTRQGAYQHPIWFSSTGITESMYSMIPQFSSLIGATDLDDIEKTRQIIPTYTY